MLTHWIPPFARVQIEGVPGDSSAHRLAAAPAAGGGRMEVGRSEEPRQSSSGLQFRLHPVRAPRTCPPRVVSSALFMTPVHPFLVRAACPHKHQRPRHANQSSKWQPCGRGARSGLPVGAASGTRGGRQQLLRGEARGRRQRCNCTRRGVPVEEAGAVYACAPVHCGAPTFRGRTLLRLALPVQTSRRLRTWTW